MEQLQPQQQPQLQPQYSATPVSVAAAPESATATPKSSRPPRGDNRCRRRTHTHGRCRLPVHDPATGLCFHHAATVRRTTYALSAAPDRADLSADLFGGPTPPAFDSPEDINRTLANLVTLVAQGRISTRRASVITYALSFILRGLQVMDQKALDVAADEPAGLICDVDSAVARHARALAAQRQALALSSETIPAATP